MSRMTELLTNAAEAMERGEDPFHISFLSEHEVTLAEAYDMSEAIATATRWYLAAQKHPGIMLALVALADSGDTDLADAAITAYLMNDVTTKLAAHRGSKGHD